MSPNPPEETSKTENPSAPAVLERIIIETYSNGTLTVKAPKDKIVTLGMIELAKATLLQRPEREDSLLRPVLNLPRGWDPKGRGDS